MRDDTAFWPAPYSAGAQLVSTSVTIEQKRMPQMMVSGATLAEAFPQKSWPRIGWGTQAPDGPCALSLRRDRLLLLNATDLSTGWHASQGFAATDMSAGLAVFQLSGTGALALLSQGGPLSPDIPSASVMRRMWGVDVMLYMGPEPNQMRLHVPAARAPAVWHMLEGLMRPGSGAAAPRSGAELAHP